tara:strand:+ start:364 stop:555 length:192 start_codon:yes stop_codon:yes gene_type:complete
MKLHQKTIERLIRLFQTYGGHRSEVRLMRELNKLNLTVYKQTSGKEVLVEIEQLQQEINRMNH